MQPEIYEDVMKGRKEIIVEHAKELIEKGQAAGDIINHLLIPAINEVGRLFDKKLYFLPQLIASAEAMKCAIEYLEPLLEKRKDGKELPTIVFATVQGDIHDIGKNLVVLMLKNYGYHMIDLGKDVPKEKIVETAIKENAAIIGLSALMTTTMMERKNVVEYAKEGENYNWRGCYYRELCKGNWGRWIFKRCSRCSKIGRKVIIDWHKG